MVMKPPVSRALIARIVSRSDNDFKTAGTVVIPLRPGECPESRADDLRRWCDSNCSERWKPLERWTSDSVRIAFESACDAVRFRLSV